MQTKPLLYGLIGFFIGGLLVSIAATTFDKPAVDTEMTMTQMVEDLKAKTSDEYDKAFISAMIAHHQAAVDMANLSKGRAKHDEIKHLSDAVIVAQQKEIDDMKLWQRQWGYELKNTHNSKNH